MSVEQGDIPTISRTLDDGTLIELLYDPAKATTAFAVADRADRPRVLSSIELPTGERLIPYSPRNNLIASGCVLLPSDIGDFRDKGELLEGIVAFLHRYVDLSPVFEQIAAHYVLLTWVYDAFSDLPYLRLRGDYGTGKTRALLAIGSLCHKAFFASGASTVSPIFHIQDAFQGTLVLDEADFRFSDATAELTKVLNNGTTRGVPVLRTMTNRNRELNPTAFRVFGPKLIAMRESFSDKALESRFLTEETAGHPVRADIPIHLPASFWQEARELRNQLLAWRFQARHTVMSDVSRVPVAASPRLKQSSLALFALIDDEGLRGDIAAHLLGQEGDLAAERSESYEAVMLTAIIGAFAQSASVGAPIAAIAERFNATASADLGRAMSNRWVGAFIHRRLRLATKKTGGVYVIPVTERTKVAALAMRFGVTEAA